MIVRLFILLLVVTAGIGCQPERLPTLTLDEFTRKTRDQFPYSPAARTIDLTRLSDAELPGADYRLAAGDLLSVTVLRLEQADAPSTVTVRVDEDGHIALPLIGDVPAAGLHTTDLENEINRRLSPRYVRHPRTSVVVAGYHQVSVLVLGAVEKPGRILLRNDERSIVHAITKARGLTADASGSVVVRPAGTTGADETLQIDGQEGFTRALSRKPLEEGDIILAAEGTPSLIYVHGLVSAPGPIQIPRVGVTVTQAIVAAGGLPNDFNADQAFLTRQFVDGSQHTVKIDLQELAAGNVPDLRLYAGDILGGPHTRKTRTEEYVRENLVFRAGIDATLHPWPYLLTPRVQIRDDQRDDGVGQIIRQDVLIRASRRATQPFGF